MRAQSQQTHVFKLFQAHFDPQRHPITDKSLIGEETAQHSQTSN